MLEAEAVNALVDMIDRFRNDLNSEEGRSRLRASIIEKFATGAVSRMDIIEAAMKGDQDADWALRKLIVEFLSLGQGATLPTELAFFNQYAMLHPPLKSPSSRNIGNSWWRDLFINDLVEWAVVQFHVPRERSRISKNPDRLSACYLVSVALGRRGININERGVKDLTRSKVEGNLIKRLSSFFPHV